MTEKRFSTTVKAQGPGGAWSYVDVPFSVEREWRSKAAVKVKGTLNGQPFRSSLFPDGDGRHHLMLDKGLMAKAKCYVGDAVEVVVAPDAEERAHPMPPDLAKAVQASKAAAANWEAFPPSARKLYVEWIEGAKREETRRARVAKAAGQIAEGKRLK